MTTIVKASNAADFLSLLPQVLGYLPTRSVVVVPFARGRTTGGLRFDLPGAGDDSDRHAATFVGMACRVHDTDSIAVVVYTDDDCAGDELPHRAVVEAMVSRADACGLEVNDALCVTPQAWGSYLDPGVYPIEQVRCSRILGPDTGSVPWEDQSSGAELPSVDPERASQVDDAFTSVCTALDGPHTVDSFGRTRIDPQALGSVEHLDDLTAFFDEVLHEDPDDLTARVAALLIWCLNRPALRDVAILGWCHGIDAARTVLEAQLRWQDGDGLPGLVADTLRGSGVCPAPPRLTRALALVRVLAAQAPAHARTAPLAACAWFAWALGRSSHAAAYAAQAREGESGYHLADIVLTYVDAAHLPEWAFTR